MRQSFADPVTLGFPEKFRAWRPDQVVAIDRTINSKKRFIGATAPTGFGKSLYAVASALLNPEITRSVYLTSTKGLQDQIQSDFSELGVFDIRGQSNYACKAIEPGQKLNRYRRGRWSAGCDQGPCHAGIRCELSPDRASPYLRPDCAYYGAVFDSRRSSFVSTNYAYWLAQSAYGEGLGDVDYLILDEAHDADTQLESFLSFEFTVDDCEYMSTHLLDSQDVAQWQTWAAHHHGEMVKRQEQMAMFAPQDIEGINAVKRCKAVVAKLLQLKGVTAGDWALDTTGSGCVRFAPMAVSKYAEAQLFRGIKKVLLTSATLTRKTTQLLGIDVDACELMEFRSSFPVSRRPIISVNTHPAVRVNARMHDSTKHLWMRRIDRLIDTRRQLGWKGIIHTVSYARMLELLKASEHHDIMISHKSGELMDMVRHFKEMDGPALFVSPSIMTGFDFPYDECRYQIIGKVPIPDMRGPIMQIRNETDPDYSGYIAMQKLVQASGRGMRAPDDWCETLIIDDTFGDWFFKRNRKHAPQWFREAIEYVESMPEPMEISS